MPRTHDLARRSILGSAGAAGLGAIGLGMSAAAAPSSRCGAGGRPSDPEILKAVETVVLTERWARDMARWDVMAEQYHPDSQVDVSWISASGPTFVDLSRRSFEAGGRSSHVLSPVLVHVDGHRATADTGIVIGGQISLGGVPVMLTAYSRIVERLEQRHGTWRIKALTCIYQFDHLTPVDPDQQVGLDPARLARYRQSYSALSYWTEETRGAAAVRDDLPGVDRPGTIDALYAANQAWLVGGDS